MVMLTAGLRTLCTCADADSWFGEGLDPETLAQCDAAVGACGAGDVFLVIGTSSTVYPAAMYAPMAKKNGATVIEVR